MHKYLYFLLIATLEKHACYFYIQKSLKDTIALCIIFIITRAAVAWKKATMLWSKI